MSNNIAIKAPCLIAAMCLGTTAASIAEHKPIKVFILSGQSNMVGAGKVTGGGGRWGSEFIDPVVSVYEGDYDPKADYDALKPVKTLKLEKFGGGEPTPYPGGGAQVTRGFVQVNVTGSYQFRPGYGGSMDNIMEVDGKVAHRKEVGEEAVRAEIKLTEGKKVPFKITYFTKDANGLGWIDRMDVPGTLSTLVNHKGKYPYLINGKGQWTSRDDVFYKGVVAAAGSRWLGVGSGKIGPELGFGHVVGNGIDDPVLILKATQGNRSLGWDFLPPGSASYESEGKVYAGYKQSPESWEKGTEPKLVELPELGQS